MGTSTSVYARLNPKPVPQPAMTNSTLMHFYYVTSPSLVSGVQARDWCGCTNVNGFKIKKKWSSNLFYTETPAWRCPTLTFMVMPFHDDTHPIWVLVDTNFLITKPIIVNEGTTALLSRLNSTQGLSISIKWYSIHKHCILYIFITLFVIRIFMIYNSAFFQRQIYCHTVGHHVYFELCYHLCMSVDHTYSYAQLYT